MLAKKSKLFPDEFQRPQSLPNEFTHKIVTISPLYVKPSKLMINWHNRSYLLNPVSDLQNLKVQIGNTLPKVI